MKLDPRKWFATRPKVGMVMGKQAGTGMVSLPLPTDLSTFKRPSYRCYRVMRSVPTIALARATATIPIRAADWSVEGDDDVDPSVVEWIDSQIEWLRGTLIDDCLLALDYGFQAFEKVFEIRDGRYFIKKLKPLRPDDTTILVDGAGAYYGLQQGDSQIAVANSFIYTHDGEHGNLAGRSRHENIREHAFLPWLELSIRQLQYAKKAAGTVGFVGYEAGTFLDADGNEVTGETAAQSVAQAIADGKISFGPIAPKDGGMATATGLASMDVRFVDAGSSVGNDFNEMLRHRETLMLRGWLIPERAVIEGQFGTKAEAGEHGDIAMELSYQILNDIIRAINWYVIDPLLAINFDDGLRGKVGIRTPKVDAASRAFFRELIGKMMTAPDTSAALTAMVDMRGLLEAGNLPLEEATSIKIGEEIDDTIMEVTT